MKKYPCIESTIEFSHRGDNIRLWIDQEAVQNYYTDSFQIKLQITEFLGMGLVRKTVEDLVEYVRKNVSRVNAIQVRDDNGFGVVAYFVEFSSDVHG